ncbi:MAG: outer membrane protein [Longimicrobiales bacterium]
MRTLVTGSLLLTFLLFGAPAAQGQVAIGPELSVAEHVDVGIGAIIEAPLASVHENLEFAGRFTIYFPDFGNYWEIDGDVRYVFPLDGENNLLPYVLAGLAIGHFSWDYDFPGGDGSVSDTEIGLRIGGGLKVPFGRAIPFAELGLGIGDIPDFSLRLGATFPLG